MKIKKHLSSLVLLRGIAALVVCFCHFGGALNHIDSVIFKIFGEYGEYGVQCFFIISGFIIPYTSNVTFETILLDEKILKAEETKQYEKKFKNEVVDNSLSNILNKSKINNFFKNFIN